MKGAAALKTLSISTAFPTVVGVPKDGEDATLESVKTRTSAGWPMNWHKLTVGWRAQLLAQLVLRIVSILTSDDQKTYDEFKRITGWGSGFASKKAA